jgi:hypothetical protein
MKLGNRMDDQNEFDDALSVLFCALRQGSIYVLASRIDFDLSHCRATHVAGALYMCWAIYYAILWCNVYLTCADFIFFVS